jgi:hypothetical protein
MTTRSIVRAKQRYRLFNFVVGICLTVFASAVGLLYFWMFDNRAVVEVVEAGATKPRFEAGEPITAQWTIIKRRACDGDVVRYLVDERETVWPLQIAAKPIFGEGTASVTFAFEMPAGAPPGRYEYQTIITWRCNPLSTRRQMLPSVPFEVVAGPQSEADAGSSPEMRAGSDSTP